MTTKIFLTLLSIVAIVSCSPAAFLDDPELSSDYVVEQTSETNEVNGRSLEDTIVEYVKSQDATFELPIIGSQVTLDSKNLEAGELNVKLSMSEDTKEVEEGKSRKKNKLKKIFVPIFIIMLLKVITLIPLALGILGLKTWNALQLSFITFVISISMAVYQLCKKISVDHPVPTIAAHGPWEAHRARSMEPNAHAQNMAYSAYAL